LFALGTTLTVAARMIGHSFPHGRVDASIPVVPQPFDDPTFHRYEFQPNNAMDERSAAVLLTSEAMYFGPVSAFTKNFDESRVKFVVPHQNGAPRLDILVASLDRWLEETQKIPKDEPILLLPANNIPMSIVIQTIAGLKKGRHIGLVVLGGALL
jgi:hypothetical protein